MILRKSFNKIINKLIIMENEQNEKNISYLTFKIGEEMFATHVNVVLNIIELPKITKVPNAPHFMKGIINLRGLVMPVVDTRLKFGLSEVEHTEKTCIIVMDLRIDDAVVHVGMLVDEVSEVLIIESNQIEPPPSIGHLYQSRLIKGVTKIDDTMIMIIDILQIFSTMEIDELSDIQEKEVETT